MKRKIRKNKNKKIKILCMSSLLLFICGFFVFSVVFGANYVYYGSASSKVKPVQQKLKQWGYYDGSIDGKFGAGTEKAVKSFQKKNNLTADGKCGKKTLEKMGLSNLFSNSSTTTSGSSSSDVELLARVVSGEARGEKYEGKVAVAAVILNRVDSSAFPNSVSGVVYQNGAFDAVSDGQVNISPDDSCIKAAKDALNGWDPSGNALYYYNPKTATNSWIKTRPIIVTIGNHVFCK